MRYGALPRPVGWGRDLMIALALFAAVLRGLVPQGFMLTASEGEPAIVICSMDGMRTLDGGALDTSKASDVLAGMNGHCAFAGLAAMAPPPDIAVVSMAQAIALELFSAEDGRTPVSSPTYRPQAPRAPPISNA